MARYPSGITSPLPGDDVPDVHVRLAQMALAIEEQPIAATAPCANPECVQPVDFLGHGHPARYCSSTCRSRAATMRRLAAQQIDLIERTLEEGKHLHSVPRDELRARVNQLRWWLTHLPRRDEL